MDERVGGCIDKGKLRGFAAHGASHSRILNIFENHSQSMAVRLGENDGLSSSLSDYPDLVLYRFHQYNEQLV